MPNTPDWSLGDKFLRENAPELIPFIDKYSPCDLSAQPNDTYFANLVTGIVAQQLPPETSLALINKLSDLVGSPITAQAINDTSEEELLGCGIMQQKVTYIKTLAAASIDGIVTFENFDSMTDAEITKQLTQIKGLGQWTTEMFLLLTLCRPDVIPTADFIMQKQLKALFNLKAMPKRKQILELTEHWRPWRSLAVWYLWQANK